MFTFGLYGSYIKCPYCGVYVIPIVTVKEDLDNEHDNLIIICPSCKMELTAEDLEGDNDEADT